MSRSTPKQIEPAIRFRFRFNGKKTRNPVSATPNPDVPSTEAVCVDSVKIESVKFAAAPPESGRVEGTKVHEALTGRPLHARPTLPD